MIEFERDPQQTIPAAAVRIIGLGGAGANMLDRVALDGMEGAELLALNTDIRTLAASVSREKIQLGENLTKGLGAGGDPELGRAATLEAEDAIRDALRGRRIVFLCVGLGGGTGSGGAPLVARMAREEGAFVVVFATMPFSFEGRRRHQQADEALNQLVVLANALVTFDNGRMGELVLAKQGVHEAFAAADRMISESIKAVIRLVIRPGLINVGLDDLMSALRTTRSRCLFGSGVAEGKDRAVQALRGALASPLLDQGALLREAESVLVHVCGGENLTLYEIELMMQRLGKHVPASAHVLFGAAVDPTMKDAFSVTLISALPEERLHAPRDADADEAAAATGTETAARPVTGADLEPSEGFEMPAAASPPRRPEPPPAAPPPAPPAAAPPAAAAAAVDVHNTAAWPRGGLVVLERGRSAAGDLVRDDGGRAVPSQRLASGELAFVAAGVPAFGTRRYTVGAGSPPAGGAARAGGLRLANDLLEVAVDAQSGAVCSLRRRGAEADWVDTRAGRGLNDYLYILGRNPAEGRGTVGGPVTVTVEDGGPLVATLRIESDAPGCAKLVRRVRLVDGADHLELVNTADKLKERRPEGVYFGFPFDLPGATARVDVPWAVVEVETDQMPGANRNFYCVQRFVDLATAERGVTWVTVDAPMVQFDPIVIAPANGTAAFRTFIDPPPHFWSWTMNNHWETNYKADQEGEITFRYVLRPYTGTYDPVAAQRFGRDVCQPLLATAADPAAPPPGPLLELAGDPGIVVTSVRPSRDGAAWIVRLFNAAAKPATTSLAWRRPVGATSVSNPLEDALKPAPDSHTLTPFEVRTLRVERAATGAGGR